MAKTTTRNLFVGDTYKIVYRCWKLNTVQEARSQFGGTEANRSRTPITPDLATVRLLNFETNTLIALDELGTTEAVATINGNEVTYMINESAFNAQGSYRAYTRIMLPDEQVITKVIQFRVTSIS